MATPQLRQHDVLQEDAFAEVRAFLSERGISPDDETAILSAIHDRGWELSLGGQTGDWTVSIREYRGTTRHPIAIAHDPDRCRALLRGLRLALSWVPSDEEWTTFDRETRDLLGISGEEFMRRWGTGDLLADDPRVQHLLLLRPLGW